MEAEKESRSKGQEELSHALRNSVEPLAYAYGRRFADLVFIAAVLAVLVLAIHVIDRGTALATKLRIAGPGAQVVQEPIKPPPVKSTASQGPSPAPSSPIGTVVPPVPAASAPSGEQSIAQAMKTIRSQQLEIRAAQLQMSKLQSENRAYRAQLTGRPSQLENVTTTGATRNEDPVWNFWLASDSTLEGAPKQQLDAVRVNVAQTLALRLSAGDLARAFPQVQKIGSSESLNQAISAGVADRSRRRMSVYVLATPSSSHISIEPQSMKQLVSIELDELRMRASDGAPSPDAGPLAMRDWLLRSQIAQVNLGFTVHTAGSHDIGISIVDGGTGYPLQSMIVRIKSDSAWPDSVSVQASGQTLFTSKSQPFDLALYLHDLKTTIGSRTESRLFALLARRQADDYEIIGWSTDTDLAGLRQTAQSVKKAIGKQGDDATVELAGEALGLGIFEPPSKAARSAQSEIDAVRINAGNAERARRLIHATATASSGQLPAGFLVAIVSDVSAVQVGFATDVVPFGIVKVTNPDSAGTEALYLGETFSLALAVPNQQVTRGDTCPEKWYVSMPEDGLDTQGPLSTALDQLRPVASTWLKSSMVHRQNASHKDFRDWLAKPGEDSGDGFVVAYLGHHSSGFLFLQEGVGDGYVYPAHVKRDFGGNSIVILNACSSAMDAIVGPAKRPEPA